MASKYWIKLYHEILDDYKMALLPDRLYRRVIELFLFAGEFDEDGLLPKVEAMAWRLRLQPDELQADLEALRDKGFLTMHDNKWTVTKFAERQAPVSDAERMRRLRERKQKEQYYGDGSVTNSVTGTVTNRNVDTDKIRRDTDRDRDRDKNTDPGPDLFHECQKIYETTKGYPVTDGQSFTLMIKEFEKEGVTAQDYREAIKAMDADPKYSGRKPTSYKNWAIGYAQERRNPKKKPGGKQPKKAISPEDYKKSWLGDRVETEAI